MLLAPVPRKRSSSHDATQEEAWRGGGACRRREGSSGEGVGDQLPEIEACLVRCHCCRLFNKFTPNVAAHFLVLDSACRYQEQSDTLRVDNYKLTEELEEQKSKLKDINEFLVNELKARALSFATLQAELAETKKTMEENQTHFQV